MSKKSKRKNRENKIKDDEIEESEIERAIMKETKNETDNDEDENDNRERPIQSLESEGKLSKDGEEFEADIENDSDDDDASESSSDDDSLVLEGTLERIDGAESSDSDDSDDDDDDDDEKDGEPPKKKSKLDKPRKEIKKSGKAKKDKVDVTNVEFIFCDMDEKFFHGLKVFLMSNPVHASHSSDLADLTIENISVGTIVATEGDTENNVYGFASVVNVSTNGSASCIKAMKEMCLKRCPEEHKKEMEVVLSGKTRRPAGFLLHDRMMNLPLEITLVLHRQLVLDMEWAVKNAEGGEEERKSLDFGVFVRMAPCTKEKKGGGLLYKHFDDEVFASNAEVVYTFDVPKGFATEEKQLCAVVVISKTGHQKAMEELEQMIGG